MFWNLQQQAEIESNTRDISTNRGDMRWNDRKITNMKYQVDLLTNQTDAMMVACQAMWEVLRDDAKIGEEKLLKKIEEVDLRDGKKDGKMPKIKDAAHCIKCQRPNNPHNICLYCGEQLSKAPDPHVFNV